MSPLGDRTASKRVVNKQLVIGWSWPFIAGCSLVESLYLSKMFTSNILSTFHSLHTQLSTPDTFNSPSPSSSRSSLEAPSRGSSRESSYEVYIDRKKTFRGVHQGTLMSISWGILLRIALTFQLSPQKKIFKTTTKFAEQTVARRVLHLLSISYLRFLRFESL